MGKWLLLETTFLLLWFYFSSLCSWDACRRWSPRCRHRWRWNQMSERVKADGKLTHTHTHICLYTPSPGPPLNPSLPAATLQIHRASRNSGSHHLYLHTTTTAFTSSLEKSIHQLVRSSPPMFLFFNILSRLFWQSTHESRWLSNLWTLKCFGTGW